MEKNTLLEQYTKIRRKDRAISDEEWIKEFLRTSPYGVLATVHDSQPFLHMNTFVYDELTHAIYMHTAKHGRFRTNIDSEEKVCFSVSKMGRLLPAKTAREMSVEYASVVVFGRGQVMSDAKEARDKMQLLIEKYFPHLKSGQDYQPITPAEINEISAYKISIEAWTAKQKQVEPDSPGAFHWGER